MDSFRGIDEDPEVHPHGSAGLSHGQGTSGAREMRRDTVGLAYPAGAGDSPDVGGGERYGPRSVTRRTSRSV